MPERDQFYQAMIGSGLSETDKQEILAGQRERFDDATLSGITKAERAKTAEELIVIDTVRRYGDQLCEMLGAPPFVVSPDHFHIIPETEWQDDETAAVFSHNFQQIAIKEHSSHLVLAARSYHEYMHMIAYGALQLVKDSDRFRTYRSGFGITSRDGAAEYFSPLNEAITEELTRHFMHEIMGHEEFFRDEAEATNKVRQEYSDTAYPDGRPFFTKDVYSATAKEVSDGKVQIHTDSFMYPVERQALNTLIHKISERGQDQQLDPSTVYWMFVRGAIVGDILPIGRLIDATFGRGTFRAIGEITDAEALRDFIDQL